ncbi:MAG: RNA-directed DNA polymerase [Candidatus Micrarchaeota archaeon]|nr:RNA-directed DNA polymerase [Candidatus Micrarchaeota archaeon]MDE1847506.1 RNA-directed DNA polymerase [Candidatus Micrarchaeota archaeon]MDE1863858.1 RNA-directed DNA polymerase [Candidatus Micrarchaeota archaeon]
MRLARRHTYKEQEKKTARRQYRNGVVHHALCNIISPILEKGFIYDSFANQNGKGTHKALRRAAFFMRKTARMQASRIAGFALKADIRHYFDTVDHGILLKIVGHKIADPQVMQLIRIILANHKSEIEGKGMPIGNLTSQFFANVYLGELDQFVKHTLKAKHYIRYVDDFVIFDNDKGRLEKWRADIDNFLSSSLDIELHKEKTKILPLHAGITFLGFRVFRDYKLLKKSNARRIWKRLEVFTKRCQDGLMTNEDASKSLDGWLAYARFANTYNLRKSVTQKFSKLLSKDGIS